MSAFAIPLLEGTDPLLTGVYKKREDPVNDCATVSQHRGYIGTKKQKKFRIIVDVLYLPSYTRL